MIIRPIAIVTVGLIAVGCTSTNQNAASLDELSQLLTADEIRSTVVGQTVQGTASLPRVGPVPFKLFFSSSNNSYQDRVVVNGNVQRATGTYDIRDTGELCRNSKSRNGGNETCWQVERTGQSYRFVDVSAVGKLKPATVTFSPGLNF